MFIYIYIILYKYVKPFQEIFNTCDKMHAQIMLGMGWCLICIFLFLKFYNFIEGVVHIGVVYIF